MLQNGHTCSRTRSGWLQQQRLPRLKQCLPARLPITIAKPSPDKAQKGALSLHAPPAMDLPAKTHPPENKALTTKTACAVAEQPIRRPYRGAEASQRPYLTLTS